MQFTLQNFEQLFKNNNIAKLCKYFKQCQLYLTNIINNAIYIAKLMKNIQTIKTLENYPNVINIVKFF